MWSAWGVPSCGLHLSFSPYVRRPPSCSKMLRLGEVKQRPRCSAALKAVSRRVRHLRRAPIRSPAAVLTRVAGWGGLTRPDLWPLQIGRCQKDVVWIVWSERHATPWSSPRVRGIDIVIFCHADDRWKHEIQSDGKCTMYAKRSAQNSTIW